MITAMNEAVDLQSMDEGTRQLVLGLMGQLQQQSAELRHKQALIFAARALKDLDPIPADFADDSYWPR